MKIAKIKNHYMFKSNNPYGTHDWLIWKDRKTGETRAVELTHLYNKDPKRFAQLKAGLLKKMNFKHRETPSGVGKFYRNADAKGRPINPNSRFVNTNVYRKSRISSKQAVDVKNFVKFKNPRKVTSKKKKRK